MSQRPTLSSDLKKVIPGTPKKQQEPKAAKKAGLLTPMQPYFAIIREDIKRLLKIDVKSREDKETYRDFMEEHFGKK